MDILELVFFIWLLILLLSAWLTVYLAFIWRSKSFWLEPVVLSIFPLFLFFLEQETDLSWWFGALTLFYAMPLGAVWLICAGLRILFKLINKRKKV